MEGLFQRQVAGDFIDVPGHGWDRKCCKGNRISLRGQEGDGLVDGPDDGLIGPAQQLHGALLAVAGGEQIGDGAADSSERLIGAEEDQDPGSQSRRYQDG